MQKVIRYCGALVIFLFTIEASARIDDMINYNAPLWGRYDSALLRSTDADNIRYNLPNARFEKWHNNQFGFRGDDFPAKKQDGLIRIVAMGTSETYGLYESPGMEWPAQLAHMLKNNKNLHVINGSTVGLSDTHYKEYLEKYVLRFDPDVIVLFINPLSAFSGIHKTFTKQMNSQKTSISKHTEKATGILSNIPSLALRVKPKIKQVIKTLIPEDLLKLYQLNNLRAQIDNAEQRTLKINKPLNVVPDEYAKVFRKNLETQVTFLKNLNVEVILSSYPTLMSLDNIDEYLVIFLDNRRYCIYFSLEGMINVSSLASNITKQVAAKYNIGFIDNNKALPKNLKYFTDNVHYTDKGAEMVAKNVAAYIKNNLK